MGAEAPRAAEPTRPTVPADRNVAVGSSHGIQDIIPPDIIPPGHYPPGQKPPPLFLQKPNWSFCIQQAIFWRNYWALN